LKFQLKIGHSLFRIGERLKIEKKITTIVSRHSFSTQLKRSGATTEYIQEALGHTDKKTTESYLDSFGKEIKKQYADMLVSFKKNISSVVFP
jgi:site-specific recombinase XerD